MSDRSPEQIETFRRLVLEGGVDPEYVESTLIPRFTDEDDLGIYPPEDCAPWAVKETPDDKMNAEVRWGRYRNRLDAERRGERPEPPRPAPGSAFERIRNAVLASNAERKAEIDRQRERAAEVRTRTTGRP